MTQPNQRRSQRVLLQIPVVAEGVSAQGAPFHEETKTIVLNAHGCLIPLATPVVPGQSLHITNKFNGKKQECRVVYQGTTEEGKTQAGIEFTSPEPGFWPVAFPPAE